MIPLNDICNDGLGLYGLCKSHNDRYRPSFVESDGELRQTYGQPIRTFLRHHMVTYHVEYWMLRLMGPNPHDPNDPGCPARLRARGFAGLDPLLYT